MSRIKKVHVPFAYQKSSLFVSAFIRGIKFMLHISLYSGRTGRAIMRETAIQYPFTSRPATVPAGLRLNDGSFECAGMAD